MIRNEFTNETAHVANWLLHSGYIDPMAVCDRACLLAQEEETENDDGYDMEAGIVEHLAPLLEDAFTGALHQTMPDLCCGEPEGARLIGLSEADYREMSPANFAVSLLAPALERICFLGAARIVAEHVFQKARALSRHELN